MNDGEGACAVRNRLEAVDLLGRQVLVIELGRIGRQIARRCAAFGMAVMVCDHYVQANVIEMVGNYRSVPDKSRFYTLACIRASCWHVPTADRGPKPGSPTVGTAT